MDTPCVRASANRGSSRTCCSSDSPGSDKTLVTILRNKPMLVTVKDESLVACVVTN